MRLQAVLVVVAALAAGPAAAADLCGSPVTAAGEATLARFGAVAAACSAGSCTARLDGGDGVWLELARPAGGEAAWQASLGGPAPIDATAGLALTFDAGEATGIPPEFLGPGPEAGTVAVEPSVAEVLVDELAKAGTAVIGFAVAGNGTTTAAFDTAGLDRALGWIDCMGEAGKP